MLTVVGAFAEVFTHPATLGLVLALTLLVARPPRLRLAAAAVGGAMAVPALLEASGPLSGAAALAGGMAAALLQAEVMLHLVLPAARFAWRLLGAALALGLALLGFLFGPGGHRRARPDLPPIEPEP